MRLSRKVHDNIRAFALKEAVYLLAVADVHVEERYFPVSNNVLQCCEISCISELVDADYFVLRVRLQHMEDEIAPDEACPSCYDYFHGKIASFSVGKLLSLSIMFNGTFTFGQAMLMSGSFQIIPPSSFGCQKSSHL